MRGEDSMAIFALIHGAADVGWYEKITSSS